MIEFQIAKVKNLEQASEDGMDVDFLFQESCDVVLEILVQWKKTSDR